MSLREEMHSLVGQITSSSETRRASLSSLRQEVAGQRESGRQHIHQLHQAHQRMARDLRSNLSRIRPGLDQEEAQRSSGVQRGMAEIRGERAAGQAVWRNFAGTQHGEKNGGTAPSTASEQGPSSPAQPREAQAPGGHRARSRDKSARGGQGGET
ncbi:MAG: hypothetical protein V1724_07920 [Chloroflexota bacterium]